MIKIFATGDIVNYTNQSGKICSKELEMVIKTSDYAICNFEAPIHSTAPKEKKSGIHHSQLKETVLGLKEQGFNLFCLANNHILDYGEFGLKQTIDEIKSKKLDFIGAGANFEEAYKPIIKNIKGFKIGIINVGEAQFGVLDYYRNPNEAGYAWIGHNLVDKTVVELKEKCDFVLVFSHAGLEHYSIPQKEWRIRYKQLVDLGVDVIIGSHPHMPQGYEYYNGSLIVYSLGNFYFDSKNYINKEDCSYSVILKLGENNSIDFEPVFHHKVGNNVVLSEREKQIKLSDLCDMLEEEYEKLHAEMCLDAYNKKIKPNLIRSVVPFPYERTIKGCISRFVRFILGRSKNYDKDLTLMHFLRNEAYYYATKCALELIVKNKKNV